MRVSRRRAQGQADAGRSCKGFACKQAPTGRASALAAPRRNICRRHRACHAIALGTIAIQRFQRTQVFLGFRAFGNDPVIQLYRGTSRAGFDDWNTTVSGDFLAEDDDSGGQIPGAATGLDAYLSGTLSSGLDNYVIRVTSYQNWRGLNQPTQSYTLSYTGFSSGTVASQTTSTQTHTSIPYTGVSNYDEVTVDPRISTRQTTNLSFSKAFDGSDKLSDQDGQLRKTIDSINAKWGNLIK